MFKRAKCPDRRKPKPNASEMPNVTTNARLEQLDRAMAAPIAQGDVQQDGALLPRLRQLSSERVKLAAA